MVFWAESGLQYWYGTCNVFLTLKLKSFLSFYREVILGDYVIGTNPDCTRNTCAPRTVTRKVGKIIIHGQYSQSNKKNDIALIRQGLLWAIGVCSSTKRLWNCW